MKCCQTWCFATPQGCLIGLRSVELKARAALTSKPCSCLEPIPNMVCSGAGHAIELNAKRALPRAPQQCSYSLWPPCQYPEPKPEFPSRPLAIVSYFFHQLVFFPQCILASSLPQVYGEHVHGSSHDAKENGTHSTHQATFCYSFRWTDLRTLNSLSIFPDIPGMSTMRTDWSLPV